MTAPIPPDTPSLRFGGYLKALLLEVPPDKVIWKTLSGVFTAEQMLRKFEADSTDIKTWVSDVARTTRELLARRAKNMETLTAATPQELLTANKLVAKGFISLLSECSDAYGPVYWHPMEGAFNSTEMITELERGSDIALAYMAAFVRVGRTWIIGADA